MDCMIFTHIEKKKSSLLRPPIQMLSLSINVVTANQDTKLNQVSGHSDLVTLTHKSH